MINEVKKTVGNRLLVRLLRMNDEVLLGNGTKLWLDVEFAHVQHTPVVGEVVVSDGESPLKSGDLIIFDRAEGELSLRSEDRPKIVDEDKTYIFLPVHAVYAAKRGEDVFSVNNYVIVLPVLPETEKNGIVLTTDPKKLDCLADVIIAPEGAEYKVGDRIVFKGRYGSVYLEHDIHTVFFPKGARRLSGDRVMGIIRRAPENRVLPCIGHEVENLKSE